jgi:hypothetical protein
MKHDIPDPAAQDPLTGLAMGAGLILGLVLCWFLMKLP